MEPKEIVLGHIGTGDWGIKLLQAMGRFARVESCYGHQNRHLIPNGTTIVEDTDSIILDDELDAVVIASTPKTHFELAKRCLHSGKNVFVEKPMCLTVEESQHVADLAHSKCLKVMVGFIYLYSSEYDRIKEHLDTVNSIKAYFLQTKARHPVHSLINLGSHFIALSIDFYHQNPTELRIEGNHDTASISMRFSDKKADVYASHISKSQKRQVIFMEDETILYNWDILGINHKVDNPLLSECKHFIDCLKTNSTPKTDELMWLKVMNLTTGGLL